MDKIQRDHLLVNQVRAVCDQSITTFTFPPIAALVLCWLLWDTASHVHLATWAGIIIAYSLARYCLIRKYRRYPLTAANARQWLDLFTIGVLISGLIWGVAVIFLIPYRQEAVIEYTLLNSLFILVICGLVTGAVLVYAASLQVVLAFALPCLLPPALYLISLGDLYNSALGGFVLLFLCFAVISSFHLNRQLLYYLKLEDELERLIQHRQAPAS